MCRLPWEGMGACRGWGWGHSQLPAPRLFLGCSVARCPGKVLLFDSELHISAHKNFKGEKNWLFTFASATSLALSVMCWELDLQQQSKKDCLGPGVRQQQTMLPKAYKGRGQTRLVVGRFPELPEFCLPSWTGGPWVSGHLCFRLFEKTLQNHRSMLCCVTQLNNLKDTDVC